MARFVLYYVVMVGCVFIGYVLSAVVKNNADRDEARIVEFLEDDDIELRCSNSERPYMNITSARFMETYQYDKRADRCQIPQTFCQGLAVDIPMTKLVECLNKRSCQLTFSQDERRQASSCGLSTPMRLVLSFQCLTQPLHLKSDRNSNPLFDSATCWSSVIRRWCG